MAPALEGSKGMTADEPMTLADLVAAILTGEGVLGFPDEYRAEFVRSVRPEHWPHGDPVQAVLARIRQGQPSGDAALTLAVAELAAREHAPSTGKHDVVCRTCPGYNAEDPAPWPCNPYLEILVALKGVPRPVRGEVVGTARCSARLLPAGRVAGSDDCSAGTLRAGHGAPEPGRGRGHGIR